MNFILSIAFFLAYISLKKIVDKYIQAQAIRKRVSDNRLKFISVCINSLLFIGLFSTLLTAIDIGYGDISLFLSSIFAVLGVALIAQWSMLSNVTASVLIFFVFPYRIGDRIKIESDEMVGVIIDIGMFHLSIKRDDGNIILYPNNLMLQKAVIKLIVPEQRVKKFPLIKNRSSVMQNNKKN